MLQDKPDVRSCRDCKSLKHKSLFTRNHIFRDGIDTLCLECNHRRVREWRAKGNRKSREESAGYYKRYPERCLARSKLRKSREVVATPPWIANDDLDLIIQARELARSRTKSLGFLWHIDHIVPLAGKDVCGLNVPWNIRVIPAAENWEKATKLIDVS